MRTQSAPQIRLNIVDRFVSFFNPEAGMARAKARHLLSIRRHEAAGRGRRHPAENDLSGTINSDIDAELDILRRRSQNMIGNNGYAGQALNVIANGIVGSGIKPSVVTESKELEAMLLKEWAAWGNRHACDWNGRETFHGIQQQVIRAVFSSGEAIVRRRRTSDGIGLQLQVHEGDYLDSSMSSMIATGDGYTQNGIEYNADGKVVAYWLFDSLETYTPANTITSRRIPASEIIHVFYADRAGQQRGLPWLRRSYMKLKDVNRYEDAEMLGKIASACHAAFISGGVEGIAGLPVVASDDQRIDRIEPGMVTYLQPNETVTFNTPPHHGGYTEFMASQLRSTAAGVGTSYEAMTGDYSQVNFSSGRMGWIEAGRNYAEKRERTMTYFLNRVWEWFMEAMETTGKFGGTLDEARSIHAEWTAPRREMLDPVKETEGIRLQLAAGLISWQEAVRGIGSDPDDVSREIFAALELFKVPAFTPSWAIDSVEVHELAKENEAKQTTADAAATQAEAAAGKTAPKPTQPDV